MENTKKRYKELFREYISSHDVDDISMMNYFHKLFEECDVKKNKKFYRYRPFNEYTLTEIINKKIYMSKLSDFDDVYEGRYLIDDNDIQRGVNRGLIDVCNDYSQKHIRVTCFSTDKKNIPMWYYYANKHTGICAEYKFEDFSFPKNVVFLPVIYPLRREVSEYKYIPNVRQRGFGAIVNSLIKQRAWSFENEWRAIKLDESSDPIYLSLKMSKIHIGANASKESIDVIKNLIDKNGLDIQIGEMTMTETGIESFSLGSIPQEYKIKI
ncbi:DUF2971 domain-containing protein [Butyrivibrio hungatei]|nr:DUF2971 domain-containing protein [Butyrivibrio hungatei]